MIRHTALVITFAISTSLAGCAKKPSCPAGAYENKDPAFCLPLPAGYKADAPQGGGTSGMSMRVSGGAENGFAGFSVYWGDNDTKTLEERAKVIDNMAGDSLKLLDKGDLPKGKWWRFRTGSENIFGEVLVKSAKGLIRCEIQNTPEAAAQTLLDACKGLSTE
ncbi:MAG: hypothetical protein U0263_06600 [Polyangiaceae bacterium]